MKTYSKGIWKLEQKEWPFGFVVKNQENFTICDIDPWTYSTDDETKEDVYASEVNSHVEGNAKLIAASPELLENLIRCVDRLEENGMGDMSAVRRAKESIKKATE